MAAARDYSSVHPFTLGMSEWNDAGLPVASQQAKIA